MPKRKERVREENHAISEAEAEQRRNPKYFLVIGAERGRKKKN